MPSIEPVTCKFACSISAPAETRVSPQAGQGNLPETKGPAAAKLEEEATLEASGAETERPDLEEELDEEAREREVLPKQQPKQAGFEKPKLKFVVAKCAKQEAKIKKKLEKR